MTSRPQSKGFTLVELLVVMAIIGILVGMLLPAVQMVREAARRTSCLNNMRQMALACQNYQSAHQRFPAASDGVYGTSGSLWRKWGFSAHTYLLPYLEQQALYDQFIVRRNNAFVEDDSMTTANDPREYLSQQRIEGFICPSATQRDEQASVGNQTWGGSEYTSHYLGVTGSNLVLGTANGICRDGVFSGDPKANGVGGLYSSTKVGKTPSDIRDGLSNCLMFGEVSRSENTNTGHVPLRTGWAYGMTQVGNVGRLCTARSIMNLGVNGVGGPAHGNNRSFNSNHPGGSQFAMCDGSAKFVSETVALVVLKRYASMDDGNVVESLE